MKTLSLNGAWRFKAGRRSALPPGQERLRTWMDASVPGTVHTDLLANGLIPDPFYRMNETEVRWVELQRWTYRKEFLVPEEFLAERQIMLVAEGLDTYASVRLNGAIIGEVANMFVAHRFNAKRHLRPGRNVLEVDFDSPERRARALERLHGRLRVANEPQRVYVRKAQYSFGWDWGPKLTTSGIWRNISLEACSGGRITGTFVRVLSVKKHEAVLECVVDIERLGKGRLRLRTDIVGPGATVQAERNIAGRRMTFRVRLPRPQLWWPNGCGGQPMYDATFTLHLDGAEVDRRETPFAVRTVRLLREADADGESFIMEINGRKVYCKGVDWIPADSFLPRIPAGKYEKLLGMARDAHMNMVRVWGGGIYEEDTFYDLCDRMGLMVWQDFMYACGEYPEQSWFLKAARSEAELAVRRLRNHPSIVLWCGNNECEWLYCTENPEKGPDDMRGATVFRDILPDVCAREDGTRPYWRSSPFGSGFPNDESNGNHHQWFVWSYWKDFKEYENDTARFVTEFGFQAPANRRTFEEATLPGDRHPQSAVMEHHNKQVEGTERLYRFQAAHYRLADSFDGFIYKGQLVQAEALKCAVEHWRRRKFRTAGALFWQLNDCWPVSSWSVIDSGLRPKAAYFAAKRFFAPLLVSFKRTPGGVEVWATSDLFEDAACDVVVTLRPFSGRSTWRRKLPVRIRGNGSAKVLEVDLSVCRHRETEYLHASLLRDGVEVSENRYFFVEPKHLKLPAPRIRMVLKKPAAAGPAVWIDLRSDVFAKNVRVEMGDALFDDNYFDLDAGRRKRILLHSTLPVKKIRREIRIRAL